MKKVLFLIVLAIAFAAVAVAFEKCSGSTKRTFKPIPVYELDTSHPERDRLSLTTARNIARMAAEKTGLVLPSSDEINYQELVEGRTEPDHIHVYWYDSSSVILVVEAGALKFYMTPEQALAVEWPNSSFIEEYTILTKDEGIVPEPMLRF